MKKVIGRTEKIDFPDFGMTGLDAKVDTGAYTSAIHCHDVKRFTEGTSEMVSFRLLDPSHPDYNHLKMTLPVKKVKRIRNSFGNVQKRIIVETRISIHGKTYKTDLSLADRSRQNYPVLLGRKAIYKRFVVDVSEKNLSWIQKNSSNKKTIS